MQGGGRQSAYPRVSSLGFFLLLVFGGWVFVWLIGFGFVLGFVFFLGVHLTMNQLQHKLKMRIGYPWHRTQGMHQSSYRQVWQRCGSPFITARALSSPSSYSHELDSSLWRVTTISQPLLSREQQQHGLQYEPYQEFGMTIPPPHSLASLTGLKRLISAAQGQL